jgi:uncharacterized protein YwgA
MGEQLSVPAAWIIAAADALNQHGSWTGRVHLHKHLFIAQVLGLADPPFKFVLYDYGPYSFELDEQIVDLELFGQLLRSYPQPGYGPKYEPSLQGRNSAQLRPEEQEALERVASELGRRSSKDLELIATCLWMKKRENKSDNTAVVSAVHEVKPRYSEPEITNALREAEKLEESLAA